MSKSTNPPKPKSKAKQAVSFSSIDTQREIRIEKLHQLRALGFDPYTPNSKRDYELGFVKYWFDYIHKFNYSAILEEDEELNNYDYFLHLVLFPRTLLEKMEEKLHLRHTVRQMGLDPDEDEDVFGDDFDQLVIDEARSFLPGVLKLSEDRRMEMLRIYLNYVPLHENDKEENEGKLTISLKPHQHVTLSGRVKSKRTSGKIAFATIEDEHCPEGFQFILKKDDLPLEATAESLSFDNFIELIDEGDYVQAYGKLDYSQRGEPSLFVEKFLILTKSLKPLPEKLEDVELRFRQRYVDMKLNTEVRDILSKKSKFWTYTKDFMDENGFLQVEAPIMQETTGGAEANPFITHHDSLDQDYYLGISPELHLKRFIVGGFEKVYDLGRNFRNEGIDDEHLQEFTRVEFYWAYANHEDLIAYCERLIKYVIEKTFGTYALLYKEKNERGEFTGHEVLVDWSQDWPRMKYYDFIQHFGGIDISSMETQELRETAKSLGVKVADTDDFGRLTDLIYKKIARPKCIQPVWLIDVPTRMSPLAKKDPNNPEVSLRSHLLAYKQSPGAIRKVHEATRPARWWRR
jgi:lysyl-tRNA synthetase class 2